tara:strand:- start:775 stop:2064 length:1290 start_codon:yes stop_codon:yes gene_type:complete
MKIEVKIINDYTREIKIDIPWIELESDFNDTIKKFGKKIKIPGFRSGKIPKERLLNQFQQNIEAEFMDTNFQKYYLMAIQKERLVPINKAEIKDVHFLMNNHLSFFATFEIEPDFKMPKLKKNSFSIQRTNYIHDQQDIDDALLQLRKSHATMQTVEEGAVEGDYLICTLQKLDESGVPIIGKRFEKQYLRVGQGSFTEDQKEKMIGLKPGDSTRIMLPINKDGEDAAYDIKVDNVEREILPKMDKAFLNRISPDLESIDALKKDVEKKIIENFTERSKNAYHQDITDALIDKVSPSFAPSMIENYLTNIIEDLKNKNNGEPLDETKVREHYKPIAERNVQWYLIRRKLIENEQLKVSDADLKNEVENLVARTPSSEKEIRKFYKKPSNLKRLEDDLLEKIILKHLEQFIKVKEVEVDTKNLREKEHEH